MPIMRRRVDVVEVIPDMPHEYATDLILGYIAVHQETESHENPRQPWCLEHQKAEEVQESVWIPSTPDIDERTRERGAEECYTKDWGDAEQERRCVGEKPCEWSW